VGILRPNNDLNALTPPGSGLLQPRVRPYKSSRVTVRRNRAEPAHSNMGASETKTHPGIRRRPGVCGDSARIGNTRISVWLLEQWRRLGERGEHPQELTRRSRLAT